MYMMYENNDLRLKQKKSRSIDRDFFICIKAVLLSVSS